MSQAKLTLRPPPNVEFVQGYPGIPPGTDRQQAAVKGTIEVRVNQQGVKAKWVRIELRKVEVLPGGGQVGTFSDFVGPNPINLWTSKEADYDILRPQDFPFYIRIPESLPPTIALEKGAGIKYELIGTVCIKGKRGFFRRRKSSVLSTASQIVIDKHELHSTWPIYSQPETRNISQDGVTLSVERGQTCYGPGDRLSVMATLKSDSLNTVILRGFEFMLRETMVFRAGLQATGKKGTPQVKVAIIAEQKLPVNATLYGGTLHKAELFCTVPSYHTSATINAARHIDITYALSIKALMGKGLPVVIDLPIIISNWPRNVSTEAVRRIGPVTNLSFLPGHTSASSIASQTGGTSGIGQITRPGTGDRERSESVTFRGTSSSPQFNTTQSSGYTGLKSDEFGYTAKPSYSTVSGTAAPDPPRTSSSGGRPGSSTTNPPGRSFTAKFAVTNHGDDIPEESAVSPLTSQQRSPAASQTQPPKNWLSAEDEKKRLYEAAKAEVERLQGVSSPQQAMSPSSIQSPGHVDAGSLLRGPDALPSNWSTAEAEKQRLYHAAKAIAERTQGLAASYTSAPTGAPTANPPALSAGAALYQQALSSVNREQSASVNSRTPPQPQPAVRAPASQYPSAEHEKTALKRYHEAKAAAARTQGDDYASSEPISYDALYPAGNSESTQPNGSPSPPPVTDGHSDLPPAFSSSSPQHPILSEKERLRRHYEAQDAAMSPPPPISPPPMSPPLSLPTPAMPPAAQISPPTSTFNQNGLSEKELLRLKYEAEDAAALQGATGRVPPTPPPRSLSNGHGLSPVARSLPLPATPGRLLTAAEEKARLNAQYEAQNMGSLQSGSPAEFSTPPPLPPRPPVQYIKETQEEDTRTQSQLFTMDKDRNSIEEFRASEESSRKYDLPPLPDP